MSNNSESAPTELPSEQARVLGEELPDWAQSDTDGAATSDSSESDNWLDDVLTGGADADSVSADAATPDSAAQTASRMAVTIGRVTCRDCGSGSVRYGHAACNRPLLLLDGTWRCGDCGSTAGNLTDCPDCGGVRTIQPTPVPLALEPDLRPEALERAIHAATNDRRTTHGVDRLEYSDPLSSVAVQHSRDMAQREYFSHTTLEGDTVADRYQTYGHQARRCGENLAKVYPGRTASLTEAADEVVTSWMNSPPHRKNLLRANFDREGIGVYLARDGAVYATQNFE